MTCTSCGTLDPGARFRLSCGSADLALSAGDLELAEQQLRRMAELSVLHAPCVLPRAARTALWRRDAPAATEDLAAYEATGFHGPATRARRATIRAGTSAIEGRRAEAAVPDREAVSAWRALGQPWDIVLTAIDMAELLRTDHTDVRALDPEARGTLGARPYLARLGAALARSDRSAATPGVTADPTSATTPA